MTKTKRLFVAFPTFQPTCCRYHNAISTKASSKDESGKRRRTIPTCRFVLILLMVVAFTFIMNSNARRLVTHVVLQQQQRSNNQKNVLANVEFSPDPDNPPIIPTSSRQQLRTNVHPETKHHKTISPCRDMDGILFISRVIRKAGLGTMLFQSIVDSLLYAKKYNLLPFIWINDDENQPCYDINVHGVAAPPPTAAVQQEDWSESLSPRNINMTFPGILTGSISNLLGTGSMACDTADGTRPGPPLFFATSFTRKTFTLYGNGFWQSYFQPLYNVTTTTFPKSSSQHVQNFPLYLNDEECARKPIFEMTRSQIMPDMHRCSEFAVRGWAFRGIPRALLPHYDHSEENIVVDKEGKKDKSMNPTSSDGHPKAHASAMQDWLWEHRQRAAPIVKEYFHLLPWVQELVEQANPKVPSRIDSTTNTGGDCCGCLAAHIRLTDKASGREKKGLDAYQPYIEAYAKAVSSNSKSNHSAICSIYIATDDATVLPTIKKRWSKLVSQRIISQPGVFRSNHANLPTFKLLAHDKHRSNTEALVDIYSMARCNYFVHGYSGMAEAVVYINPKLHSRSVNIDDDERMTPHEWEQLIRTKEDPGSLQPQDSPIP